MDWLINLFTQQNSVAHIVLLFSIVIAVGVLLGKIKICGISLACHQSFSTSVLMRLHTISPMAAKATRFNWRFMVMPIRAEYMMYQPKGWRYTSSVAVSTRMEPIRKNIFLLPTFRCCCLRLISSSTFVAV